MVLACIMVGLEKTDDLDFLQHLPSENCARDSEISCKNKSGPKFQQTLRRKVSDFEIYLYVQPAHVIHTCVCRPSRNYAPPTCTCCDLLWDTVLGHSNSWVFSASFSQYLTRW